MADLYDAGYMREGGEAYSPTAVRWWVLAVTDDGWRFARGGRVPTARAARAEIAGVEHVYRREKEAWLARRTHELVGTELRRRFTHELMPDGSLRPLIPHDLEVDDPPLPS